MERSATIKAIQAQRESRVWLDEDQTLSVTIRRPPEGELWQLVRGIELEHIVRYTVGWSGFTEASVINGGAEDELLFHAELFREVVIDRADWISKIADAIAEAVKAHSDNRKAASGN
jgi:hypothetical protein